MYERNSWLLPVCCLLVGLGNGFNIGYTLENNNSSSADARVQTVQIQNEQLDNKLLKTQRIVARLVLNDGQKTFKFDSVNTEGQSETCAGKYEVSGRDTVAVIGNLACTSEVSIK